MIRASIPREGAAPAGNEGKKIMEEKRSNHGRGVVAIVLGALLFLGGMGLTGYNMYDDSRAGREAYQVVQTLAAELPPQALYAAPVPKTEEEILVEEARTLPVRTVDGKDYVGLLQFPDFELELPVQTPYSLEALNTSPCLYAGDPYHNSLVICAHNFDSHFGRLKSMQEGDEVLFIAMDGEVFRYVLSLQEVLQPTSVEEMVTGEDWDMTLFTCTLGGEYRVTARFVRQDDRPA